MISLEKEDQFEQDSRPQISQAMQLMQKKSTYFSVMVFLAFIIVGCFGYSEWRYIETSLPPPTLQSVLPIHAGEIHYSRIPREYWQHRIRMIKGMGFNSLSVYVMWNHHELPNRQFDFTTDTRDLVGFLDLAVKHGMKVLLRPGPYVCAEWDFGGLPARLLGMQGLRVREPNTLYEAEVRKYFTALSKVLSPFLLKRGGPIIMIQIQNQLGYYIDSPEHMTHLREMWKELGIESEFYYEQPYHKWQTHYWPGAHIGISGGEGNQQYQKIQTSHLKTNDSLFFGGEIYSGWITFWGDSRWGGRNPVQFGEKFNNLIMNNRSASVYLAIGGTNFGLTAGSNGYQYKDNKIPKFRPQITSYDYDALITEQGGQTQKYAIVRSIFQAYYGHKLGDIPEAISTISFPQFLPSISGYLFGNLPQASVTGSQLTFFQSHQLKMYNQGIAVYQTELSAKGSYKFKITVHDLAIIYLNDRFLNSFVRKWDDTHIIEVKCESEPCKLKILVEAMGHLNFGEDINDDRKGILHFSEVDRPQLNFKWKIYKIELDQHIFGWSKQASSINNPVLFKGQFQLQAVGDTFIDMKAYEKGYLWVNGHLLGRYWNVGPQQRLYCPGIWLKNGKNTVYILQLFHQKAQPISGMEKLAN